MLDVDTFLTALYFMADNFFKALSRTARRPGPDASLSPGEVITLALFARFSRFASERDFHRYAESKLTGTFLTLPDRSQFNRLVLARRTHRGVRFAFGPNDEGAAMVVRNSKRQGSGWLAGQADIRWSNRLGWYEGFKLLISVSSTGVITGFGFGSASTADQPLAQTFLKSRHHPDFELASVGEAASGCYVSDKGFEGLETTAVGSNAMGRESSIRPNATAA